MQPRLIVQQKITPFVNKYHMYGVNPDGSQASSVGLAQQKRLAMKEKATIYSDDTKQTELCNFHAEKMMDIHGRYFVEDPQGNLLGMFKKEFAASLLNSTWKILDSKGNEILIIKESNATLAFLRRFVAYIPFVGEVADGLMAFLKYHFMFIDVSTQNKVGTYTKSTLFRDTYRLNMTDETWSKLDWRVYTAMCVPLDMLQSR